MRINFIFRSSSLAQLKSFLCVSFFLFYLANASVLFLFLGGFEQLACSVPVVPLEGGQ